MHHLTKFRGGRLRHLIPALAAAAVVITLPITVAVPAKAQVVSATGRIAFASDRNGDSDIFVMNADGSGLTQMTADTAYEFNPKFSVDGTRIAFETWAEGTDGKAIMAMEADGSGLVALTDGTSYDELGSWAPDGRIVFVRESEDSGNGYSSHVWVMQADGSGLVQLTSGTDVYASAPVFSPDGSQIAFVESKDDGSTGLYVMNDDGTDVRLLTDPTTQEWVQAPAWSPDGSLIAFVSDATGNDEIYLLDATAGGSVQITDTPGYEGSPSFAPDGSGIAFDRWDDDANEDIFVLTPDGLEQNLTNDEADDYNPNWGPAPAGDL
jgi:TolB protein